ncbi:GNAT family N-acetyltransferase [Halodesulfovibrio marinisediminis]|uniref:Acetyltransferase (GNAT) family protein n=1 Tax=Halodesulfovibrio marinisediminis DSM 17456 TaxID=1121457 RepID=A0A1N6J214_9BACT|nr:GNAT family N-acetyltransferase [Halodesulfovibrio marinisediminis]SIO38291.1 Acetyltransferase (GNAT) family protein [Halodesulfovibrio marinisediminis DSM 17456]
MLYSVEEIDKEHDLYEATVAMRCVDLYPVGRVTRSYIQDELEDRCILLVALKNRKVLGCGRLSLQSEIAEISHIVVGEEYRFTGVGTSLMHKFLQRSKEMGAKKIHLESTPEAVPFFKRFGFVIVGKPKKLEILDLPALDMECEL